VISEHKLHEAKSKEKQKMSDAMQYKKAALSIYQRGIYSRDAKLLGETEENKCVTRYN